MKIQQIEPTIVLGDLAYRVLRENFQKVVDREVEVIADKDPESLHQMRVAIRRLHSALKVFTEAIVLSKEIEAANIRKFARSLGDTRDLDVLQQSLLDRYQPLLQESEKNKFFEVIAYLQQKHDRCFLDLKKTLKSDRYRKFKKSMRIWLDKPDYTVLGKSKTLPLLSDLLLPSICQLFLHSGWFVGSDIESGKVRAIGIETITDFDAEGKLCTDILHDLRKQVKDVRYRSEFFAGFYGEDFSEKIVELKQTQELLGDFQDNNVLHHFLESKMKLDLKRELPNIDRYLEQNLALFWQKWKPMQQNYLSLEFRQSWRSMLLK
jgi:CHAD domain-containing protein